MAGNEAWQRNKGIARAILSHPGERRRTMTWLLGLTLAVFVTGLWIIDDWLSTRPLVFAVWWSGSALLTLFLMLFALYDVLKIIQEGKKENDP